MSQFSGKCDLYDHIMMLGAKPNKDNPSFLESDDMESFNIFKHKTGGVIYQSIRTELSDDGADLVIKNDPWRLSKKELELPNGKKKGVYEYCGKECTLRDLNKNGFWTRKPIYFDDILDLVPYYPYIVCISVCDQDKEFIQISSQSYVDEMENEMLGHGIECNMSQYYRKELKDEYIRLVHKYF